MTSSFTSKRKQDVIPRSEVRTKQVKVMLNESEFFAIDEIRKGSSLSRAEVMRLLVFNKKIERPPVVPEVNIQLARDLGKALGNLATLAGVMRDGVFVEIGDVKYVIQDLQKALRGQK